MAVPKPVARMAQQRQPQRDAALRLASQNVRQAVHNPAFPGIPGGVQNIALERGGIPSGGIGIRHAPNPIFYSPAPVGGYQGPTNNETLYPGGVPNNPNIGIKPPQPPVVDPSGLANTSDGTQIYTDPVSGLQYQNIGGQWAETSGHLTDPGAGTGTYNGLPQGVNQLMPGQQGYSAPGTPMNQVPGYYQADAQGGYISGDWNAYSQYANSRGVTPFAGPGSTYGGNPISNSQQPGSSALQQAMVNASQSGANSNPNVIQPTQPVTPTPTNSIPTSAPPVASAPVTSVAPNPQQLGNQNIPGYADVTHEGGQPTANRILPRPNAIATRPVIRPLGNMMGSGFGGAASRLMGRL